MESSSICGSPNFSATCVASVVLPDPLLPTIEIRFIGGISRPFVYLVRDLSKNEQDTLVDLLRVVERTVQAPL